MINLFEVKETNQMIEEENLDVRTITLGISLMDCIDGSLDKVNRKIYDKITTTARNLVETGREIEREYGIPIVNKRISVTPIALVGGAACRTPEDFASIAETLDRAAHEVGVNFIGGYSALVSKGMTRADELLIRSIPQAMARTSRVCSSVNVGSTKTGINMDAVKLMGEIVKQTAESTRDQNCMGCAKLVVFCNAPDDNPFMAGAFHGVTEADAIINVGVSGPGVVKHALEKVRGENFEVLCETIKKTAFKVTRVGQLVAQEASRRLGIPLRDPGSFSGAYPGGGRFRGGDPGGDRPGGGGSARDHGGAGAAERSGEKGRRYGVLLCGRPLRSLHPRQRRSGHDRRGKRRRPDPGKAGGHDLCLLRGAGYDRHSRQHRKRHDLRHYRG